MIDEPADNYSNLKLAEQYLDLKFPDKRNKIIRLLEDNNIYSDSEIAFDEKIITKFRTIAHEHKTNSGLIDILIKFDIETKGLSLTERTKDKFSSGREKKLAEILDVLFQLATNWEILKDLEDKADNFSMLNEEEVIRPDEAKSLDALDDTTLKLFYVISEFTKSYIEMLTDYYFTYGGDASLKDFVEELEKTKKLVAKKYLDLFQKNGIDSEWLEKLSS